MVCIATRFLLLLSRPLAIACATTSRLAGNVVRPHKRGARGTSLVCIAPKSHRAARLIRGTTVSFGFGAPVLNQDAIRFGAIRILIK